MEHISAISKLLVDDSAFGIDCVSSRQYQHGCSCYRHCDKGQKGYPSNGQRQCRLYKCTAQRR